jgi:thioesterase domain-containing protein
VVLARLVLVVIAFGTVVGLTACGGDGADPLELDTYFSEMERLRNEREARRAEVQTEYERAIENEPMASERFKQALTTYYTDLVSTGKNFVNQIDDLVPPDELEDIHEEYIESYDATLSELNAIIDDIPSVQTPGEVQALVASPDLDAAIDRGNAACASLQEAAVAANIDVDFGCVS